MKKIERLIVDLIWWCCYLFSVGPEELCWQRCKNLPPRQGAQRPDRYR